MNDRRQLLSGPGNQYDRAADHAPFAEAFGFAPVMGFASVGFLKQRRHTSNARDEGGAVAATPVFDLGMARMQTPDDLPI